MQLRLKLYGAFSLIAVLAIALGCYGMGSLSSTGDIAIRLYDEPLIAVSYARASTASLTAAHDLMTRGLSGHQGRYSGIISELDRHEADIAEDLRIVRERIHDQLTVETLDQATAAIAVWLAGGRVILDPPPGGVTALPTRSSVERNGVAAARWLDDLVEHVSALGFGYRARAVAQIHASAMTLASLAGGIIATSALSAVLFASLLIRPIRAAARFAEDIAADRSAGTLSTTRRDEIGRLFGCLATMQINLRERADQALTLLRQQEQAAEALRRTNLRFEAALNNMSHGLLMYDADATIAVVNRRFSEIYGIDRNMIRAGGSHSDLLALSVAAGNHPDQTVDELIAEVAPLLEEHQPGMATRTISGGRTIAVSYNPMPDGGWISMHEDITERCKSLEQIAFLARHDPLTRLPNRLLFQERLEAGLQEMGDCETIALLCLDLDQFKMVNDSLGHPIGDQLLVAVAERLQSVVRKTDTIARLGGDEFAIVQRGVETEDEASALAGRIIRVVSKPYDLDCHRVSIGVSVGIALAPEDARQRQELLRKADLALYSAKQQGRGTWRLFQPALDDVVQGRRKMEYGLRQALRANQLELYYQPVVAARTRRLSGFEALLRWNHPTRGMVPPNEFIPLAEETGLIVEIGAWVIEQACAQAAFWPDELSVAVNLSAVQFRSDLVRTVADAIDAHGLTPDRLVLEITESVLLQHNQSTLSTLHVLRGLGVQIAMDDFGTGYSSLSYLRSFPFDTIKIDQSFVRGLEMRDECTAIIRAVIGLGHSLRTRIIAEGVETEEQLEILAMEGCSEVQGYFFSKPVPAAALPDLIRRLAASPQPVMEVPALTDI